VPADSYRTAGPVVNLERTKQAYPNRSRAPLFLTPSPYSSIAEGRVRGIRL